MRTALGEIPDQLLRRMTMAEAQEYLLAQPARPSRRAFLRGAGAGAALMVAGPILWRQSARATGVPPAAVHLSHGQDASTQMVVAWSSPVGMSPVVRFGPPGSGTTTADVEGSTVAGVPSRVYYRAALDRLEPSRTYTYEIDHGAGATRCGSFTTASRAAKPFRFAALGDMGASAAGQEITGRIVGADPDLVFFVGDLCYADRFGGAVDPLYTTGPLPVHQDLAQWDAWLAQVEPSASTTPWMFTTGNHEMEVGQGPLGYDGFLARMHLPLDASGHVYYAFRYQGVAFVALDANDVSYEIRHNHGYAGGSQEQWLERTLSSLRGDPEIDFIVVGFHHCMYCSNTVHGSDAGPRDRWGHLFDRYAVDLVVNGHNHSYERTHPVQAGDPTRDDTGFVPGTGPEAAPRIQGSVDGTVYVTAGGGGQQSYPTSLHPASFVTMPDGSRQPEISEWSAVRYLGDHSVLVVDVEPSKGGRPARMKCEARAADAGPDGAPLVVDRFVLERSAHSVLARPPSPTTTG